jgi:nicotinamide-nucleotide amidase
VRRLHLAGERGAVRAGTVAAAIDLARAMVDGPAADDGRPGEIGG